MVFKAVILVAMLCVVNGKVLLYDSDTGLVHAVKEILAPVGDTAGLANAVPAVDVPADKVPADAAPADVVSIVDVAADPAHNSAKVAEMGVRATCNPFQCQSMCKAMGKTGGFCMVTGDCVCI